ncbi:MAG: glutamate-1-semialdehyde aminotransferase [marine actinobacterium MedAcidi-G2B]|nr:MAG: glutamate-1-semialdehyde aminotransferase [marine actinobacterium MedAcidi-G2B]MDC0245159.1 glutamate-1-semialdehyde 2,1-aminomutase [Acidimicrobiaceae bacterium]|tara:strand:+ start:20884 stop:22143 length:1260 start_codon:yes stop_codon:yes gene_type:complete
MTSNSDLFLRAKQVIPGGVNSPVRAFGSVGGTPYFVTHAKGPFIYDAEENCYIDYVQSYGPGILGHAHPAVIEAITEAAAKGTTFGAPTEAEIKLAEMVSERIQGLELVRFVSSGTEATMSAIRLARGATGRNRILKFAGCYHGHSDALLAAGGSGVANQGLSGCEGVTPGAVADTIVAPYNVVPEIDETVAAIIVEPVAANMGLVAPNPSFLNELRKVCDQTGALLIFDEVITGFRLAYGGAAEYFGVAPDIWCFGKVVGGGLPVGAFGARREIMENLAPLGGVYQAGTLSGNPLAMAAGRATLELLNQEAHTQLATTATRLADGLDEVFSTAGFSVSVPRVGSLVGLFFGDQNPPTNFDEAQKLAENGIYSKVFHALLKNGVALAPGPYEGLFPSLVHSDQIIDTTLERAASAVASI